MHGPLVVVARRGERSLGLGELFQHDPANARADLLAPSEPERHRTPLPRESGRTDRPARQTTQPFHFRLRGPVYCAIGRISRLFACCSMTCAHQPVIRDATKIGVYWGTAIPIV